MSADPTSLDHLFDIVTPPPVPSWPPAPGWFVMAGTAAVLVGAGIWRAWQYWRAAAYRRAALGEWQRLRAQAADLAQRQGALRQLPELVKRTALVAFPREEVASLRGTAWLSFLDRTGHTNVFTHGRGQLLSELAYNPRLMTQLDTSAVEELFTIVRHWIRAHSSATEIVATRS
jgi:Domain of unknown function (DUF4381)